ncbi:MAG: hypothetical protein H7145_23495 [Akkermansiaceae bacterium]|nr:hypothetical protein [Armatimonadota bacterium]
MMHDTTPAALLLLATFAIFSFGKRKSEPVAQSEPISTVVIEDADEETDEEEEDTEGETLPVLATFSLSDELYEDRAACEQVWNALALPVRTAGEEAPTHFFALTAFDPAPPGRDAVALTACKLAQDATQRGYSVLLVDADISRPTLDKLPLFAPRDDSAEASPPGLSNFLRGDMTRLEPLLKLASRTEGLLLLPAGNISSSDETLSGSATWERLLRLAAPLAEIVLVIAPPVFVTDAPVRNQVMLPKMDGVLVAYPSQFSAASDTEALEKMESMRVPQVGAIVAPPAYYDEEGTALPALVSVPAVASEPTIVPGFVAETPESETEPETEVIPMDAAQATDEAPIVNEVPPTDDTDDRERAVQTQETVATPIPIPLEKVDTPRPSFLSPVAANVDKPRGDARRAVPIDTVPVYNSAPVHQSRPVSPTTATMPPQANEIMSTPNTQYPVANTYRPDVAIELLPTSGTPALLTLRAEVGGTGNGPVFLLEIQTLATEAKRLRADNPGTHASAAANAPLLVLEALIANTAPEDATTLRLVVRESSAEGAATLLDALLETPDALRIKSGKATTVGVPPVRFEVTTEPDDTARFRATIPPLDNTPALFADMERTALAEGRLSRIVLRLA